MEAIEKPTMRAPDPSRGFLMAGDGGICVQRSIYDPRISVCLYSYQHYEWRVMTVGFKGSYGDTSVIRQSNSIQCHTLKDTLEEVRKANWMSENEKREVYEILIEKLL